MKPKRYGFTIVELLTVLAIIAMLVGVLIPTLSTVRNMAKVARQKSQFNAISQAITTFRNDYGNFPPSASPFGDKGYTGTQMLTEALLGRDLMGFHPETNWDRTDLTYYPVAPTDINLEQRKGLYLDLAATNVFRLGDSSPGANDGLYRNVSVMPPDNFVICDVFDVQRIRVGAGSLGGSKSVRAGTPILYYKANINSKTIDQVLAPLQSDRIYDARDNAALIGGNPSIASKGTKLHRLCTTDPTGVTTTYDGIGNDDDPDDYGYFYQNYIVDPKITARPWPYRSDSYMLISAGPDGEYGTRDDVTNFGY